MENKIYVVEGIHDEAKIKKIFKDIKVVSVNGLAVNQEKITLLKSLSRRYTIVLMLDPDGPGNKVRNILASAIGDVKHIYFKKEDAISRNKKKVGIEHIDDNIIKEYLQYEVTQKEQESDLTMESLLELSLVGHPNAKANRNALVDILHLGKSNAKTLLKKLHWLGLNKKDLIEVINDRS